MRTTPYMVMSCKNPSAPAIADGASLCAHHPPRSSRTAGHFFVPAILGFFTASLAYAHGDYDWIRQGGYLAANGDLCCGENDCYHLAMVAHPVKDGWAVTFNHDGKRYERIVPDQAVYKSENNEEWICLMFLSGLPVVRCVFLPVAG